MELLKQNMKQEMERCKKIAKAEGLNFDDNTLEYIVSNRDMIRLSPKIMIPTLYDYWVHDIGVVGGQREYDAFPHNPYETVINTRPAMSFYNQDNTDWFNVMIFYHVLGHIDCFQNNINFRNTWDDDFAGQALADKRLLNRIREDLGPDKRWVDYVIEFSRTIENLVGYYPELKKTDSRDNPGLFGEFSEKIDFYFGRFLKERYEAKVVNMAFYHDEIARLNKCFAQFGQEKGEDAFFEEARLKGKFPEFQSIFRKWKEKEHKPAPKDIFEYLWENSEFLKKEENAWMVDVMRVVRRTSLYFQPQIRTKILNEGWASYWHERLFISDSNISTHEVDYARVNAGVTTFPRIGSNPYAMGKQLFEFIEEMGRTGKLSHEYQLLKSIEGRKNYDLGKGDAYGKQALFEAAYNLNDSGLINFLSDKDFQDFVDKNNLFIAGVRPHREKWDRAEVYIKSRNGKDYRELVNKQLYHPPRIEIEERDNLRGELYLNHIYEGRSLHSRYIPAVLRALEFFWGKATVLETTVYEELYPINWWEWQKRGFEYEHKKLRVIYVCENGEIEKIVLY